MAAKLMTAGEVAEQLGTEPKVLRRFLRENPELIEPVGKGHRYAIPAAKVRSLTKAWNASHSEA